MSIVYPNRPRDTATDFFREPNIEIFAREIAPALGRKLLRIADVGCGTDEPWTVATALAANGVNNFHVDAFDAQVYVVMQAKKPVRQESFRRLVALTKGVYWAYPEACTDFFDPIDKDHVRLQPDLQQKLHFARRDLRTQELPRHDYAAVIANNFLYYYEPGLRTTMFARLLRGVGAEGFVMFEGAAAHEYREWTASLPDRFPIRAVPIERRARDRAAIFQRT